MRTHRQHNSLAYQYDIGQEVVSFTSHHYGVPSHLGSSQDIVAHLIVAEAGSGTSKEGCTRRTQFQQEGFQPAD